MNMRTAILSIALLAAAPLLAREKTDVLVMRNGDRMTCEVKGLDKGVLYVSFDYIEGTISVDWSKVARIESRQLFVVQTADGFSYTGTLGTPEGPVAQPVQIQILETTREKAMVDQSQVTSMVGTSESFWRRFSGDLSIGIIYSKGNQSTQYSLSSQTAYVRERWSAQASFDSTLASSSGVNTSTRNSVTLGARRLLRWNQWFYAGLGTFLQSSEQGITLQTALGGGIGRYLKNTNRTRVAVLGGAAWQSTTYRQTIVPVGRQNVAAGIVYAEAHLFRFDKTNLDLTGALLPAVTEPGRVVLSTKATYYVKLVSDLKWNLSFYGNWDNRPPTGLSASDYGTSSGLTWTFGMK